MHDAGHDMYAGADIMPCTGLRRAPAGGHERAKFARFTALRMYAEAVDNLLGRRHNEDRRATSSELRMSVGWRRSLKFGRLRMFYDATYLKLRRARRRRPESELNSSSSESNDAVNASMVTPRNWQTAWMVLHKSVICNFLRSNDLWQAG